MLLSGDLRNEPKYVKPPVCPSKMPKVHPAQMLRDSDAWICRNTDIFLVVSSNLYYFVETMGRMEELERYF